MSEDVEKPAWLGLSRSLMLQTPKRRALRWTNVTRAHRRWRGAGRM